MVFQAFKFIFMKFAMQKFDGRVTCRDTKFMLGIYSMFYKWIVNFGITICITTYEVIGILWY